MRFWRENPSARVKPRIRELSHGAQAVPKIDSFSWRAVLSGAIKRKRFQLQSNWIWLCRHYPVAALGRCVEFNFRFDRRSWKKVHLAKVCFGSNSLGGR